MARPHAWLQLFGVCVALGHKHAHAQTPNARRITEGAFSVHMHMHMHVSVCAPPNARGCYVAVALALVNAPTLVSDRHSGHILAMNTPARLSQMCVCVCVGTRVRQGHWWEYTGASCDDGGQGADAMQPAVCPHHAVDDCKMLCLKTQGCWGVWKHQSGISLKGEKCESTAALARLCRFQPPPHPQQAS